MTTKMRRGVAAMLAAVSAIALAATLTSPATAKPSTHKFASSLVLGKIDFDFKPGRFVIYGDVESDNAKCLPSRAIKLFSSGDGGETYQLTDTSTTSANGDWIVDGPTDRGTVKIVLAKSKFGSHKHPKSCAGDTLKLD